MNNFTYENQGINTYLVYTLKETDSLDSMSLGMVTNNKIPGIANTVFMQADTQKYIKYNVSSKVSVKQFFTGAVNKKRLLGVFHGIVDAMLSAEEYMIDTNMILLDLDYIFADVSTCETVLICVPVLDLEIGQHDLGMFFKQIMFSTQFDQTENCDHVAKIINYLNSTTIFSLVDFQQLLESIDSNFGNTGVVGTNNNVAKQQPKVQQTVVTKQETNTQPFRERQMSVQQAAQTSVIKNPAQGINIPKSDVAVPISQPVNEQKKESAQGEKPMSMFYLLQHYNKENAAAYKVQKEAKKAEKGQKTPETKKEKKEKKPKKGKEAVAPPPMKGVGAPGVQPPNFAIPGQTMMPPPKEEPINKAAQQTTPQAKQTPPPVVQQKWPVQNEVPVQTPVHAMQQPVQSATYTQNNVSTMQSANFGETTVLDAGNYGETTVLTAGPAQAMVRTPYLIRSKNNEKIPVNKPVFRIGKERSYVDYFIGDNTAISRSHANIVTRDGQYFVVDTNSTNHVYVNGQMIPSNQEILIREGDKIRLANEDFTFQLI